MTLNRPQSVPNPGDKVEFDDSVRSAPLFTALMIMGTLACYIFSAKKEEYWIGHYCWSTGAVTALLHSHDYSQLANLIGTTNFASFNMIHMGMTMYFFWVFGGHIEGKIGTGRYLPLVLMGMTLPWFSLLWDTSGQPNLTIFGALFVQCAIIGAYLVLPPVPLKRYGGGNYTPKNQIFKVPEKKNMQAKYTANPWMFLAVFAAFQLIFHFWCSTGIMNPFESGHWVLVPFGKNFDTFRLLPTLIALGIGYLIATMSVSSASQALSHGPLAIQALRRYHELLALDVKHEEALRGTARTLGLSYDKTKELVMKNKGKMRIK
jgi:membrane associated rhomboid family serine protease